MIKQWNNLGTDERDNKVTQTPERSRASNKNDFHCREHADNMMPLLHLILKSRVSSKCKETVIFTIYNKNIMEEYI